MECLCILRPWDAQVEVALCFFFFFVFTLTHLTITVQNPKALVVVVHGYCEGSHYYNEIAHWLNDAGIACFGIDHVGHGKSEGERGYIESIDKLADDVSFLAARLKKAHPFLPLFLWGHSMGGMISIFAAQKDKDRQLFKGVYLEAPLVKIDAQSSKWWQRAAARLLSFLPKLKVKGAKLNRDRLTRNESLKRVWDEDKLLVRTETFIQTGNSFLDGEETIESWLSSKEITFPFFLATGDDDVACDPKAGRDFYERANSADKKFKLYPAHRHNLKYESDEVKADAVEWFVERIK